MAFIAAAVISGVAAVGGGYLASKGASDAADTAAQSSAEQIAFEREKYNDFKATYGGIEENLSEYYSTLTPEYYEARGLEAFQQEQQLELSNIKASLAQRGIEDSGIALATETAFAQQGATGRAKIRAEAPSVAAEEQRSFLQVGLGQNPGTSYSQALSDKARQTETASQAASQVAGQAVGTAITTVGTGLSDYLSRPTTPTYTPVGTGSTGLGKYEVT